MKAQKDSRSSLLFRESIACGTVVSQAIIEFNVSMK
jgi:hypothetical protein